MEINFELVKKLEKVVKSSYLSIQQSDKKILNVKNKECNDIVTDDGTINFAAGIPLFSTSVALKKKEETIFGMVFDYSQDDVYYAIKGEGAFCNGNRLTVSNSAAGKLFVQEAGGKVTNLQGKERMKVDTMLVTNGKIHDELVKAMQ